MANSYINPNLSIYQDTNEFFDQKNYNKSLFGNKFGFNFQDFYIQNLAFVLGEPGCGKSTLLNKIVVEAKSHNKKAISLPLNLIKNSIVNAINSGVCKSIDSIDDFSKKSCLKTDDFILENNEDIIVCLDALDEVSSNNFNRIIIAIKEFAKVYDKVSIFITCREHYIKNSLTTFNNFFSFKFIKIRNFDDEQIKKYLEENISRLNKDKIVETLIKKSKTNQGESILSIPRYLEVQVDILKNKEWSEEEIFQMRRIDFFDEFIYKKLDEETTKQKEGDSNVQKNENIITKRVLEKLALIMEIYQVTRITKEELMTFLDDTNSNANLIFLNHCSIDTFIERVLKHFDNSIEFDNTEFQEYLAAKELLRLGQKSQVLYDLIVEPTFKHVHSNWYDVLRYVIEIDANQIMPLIDFLKQKGEYLIEDDYFNLISTLDEDALTNTDKEKIFDVIFSYHQKSHLYLWHHNAEKLCSFYQSKNYNLLKDHIQIQEQDDERKLSNQITIVEELIGGKFTLDQKKYWIDELKAIALNTANPKLQQQALYALRGVKNIDIYKELSSVYDSSEIEVKNCFIRCCKSVNPNNEFSINTFCEGIKSKIEQAFNAISNIVDQASLKYLLDKFIQYPDLLKEYIFGDGRANSLLDIDYESFVQHLSEVCDQEIDHKLKNIFTNLTSTQNRVELYQAKNFYRRLIILLNEKDPNFIYELGEFVSRDYMYYDFRDIISEIIKPEDIKKFIERCKDLKYGDPTIGNILVNIKYFKNPLWEQVYEEGRKYIPEKYEQWENYIVEEPQQKREYYGKFKEQIKLAPGYFDMGVFATFYKNHEQILSQATKCELNRLRVIIRNIFKYNDTRNYRITIVDTSSSSRSITHTNTFTSQYLLFYKIAELLGLQKELQTYRRYFIQIIPVLYDTDQINYLLDKLGILNDQDIKDLISICTDRTDDFLLASPQSMVYIARKIKRKEFETLLKHLFETPRIRTFEKEEILECIGAEFHLGNEQYFQDIFDKYVTTTDSEGKYLSEIANKILIRKFRKPEAIEWRFSEIKSRNKPYTVKYESGFRSVSNWESELDRPKFFSCIIDLEDSSLIPKIQELLKFSFEIRKQLQYVEYSNYLQKNIFAYYIGIKEKGVYSYIKELKDLIDDNIESKSFKIHLRNLEISYIEKLNRPQNISDSIKKYNEIKSKQYQPLLKSLDLFYELRTIIQEDVRVFIEKEGFYKPIRKFVNGISRKGKDPYINEELIQKTIKVHIENGLLKRGFRNSDIHREVQLYDDKRLDLLINYGFVGPVMLELKLLHNNEIIDVGQRTLYKEKIKQYLAGSHSEYGIYVVFKVKNESKYDTAFLDLKKEYEDIKNLHIELINCC